MSRIPRKSEKGPGSEMVLMGIRLPSDLARKTKKEAVIEGVTIQGLVRACLVVYFAAPGEHKNKVLEIARAA